MRNFANYSYAERALPEYSNLVSGVPEGTIQMAGGFADPSLFPVSEIADAVKQLTQIKGSGLMQYHDPHGFEPLLRWLSNRLSQFNEISANNVLLTSGAQQGLDIVSKLLVDTGDTVVVEAPTFHGALWVFKANGAKIVDIPMDEEGMNLDILESRLSELQANNCRPKFIYTVPTFHNPTGNTLSLNRRRKLIEIAKRFEIPIIEDIPYSELWYDQSPPPSLLEIGGVDLVTQLGSFSKTLCPSLRTGWIAGPPELIRKGTHFKHIADTCSSGLLQQTVLALCESGFLDQNKARARRVYTTKRDVLICALRELSEEIDGIDFSIPGGGFFVWLRLNNGTSAEKLKQAAREEGVLIASSSMFFADGQNDNCCRLTFSYPSEKGIKEGVQKLKQALIKILRS